MSEAEEKANQFGAEVTANKAEPHTTLNPKEDEQPDTKRNGELRKKSLKVASCPAQEKIHVQGKEEEGKCPKTCKKEPVSVENVLAKSAKTNKGDPAKNGVKEEAEVTVDQCNAGPCEQKSEKERSHAEERDQAEGGEKTEEGCLKEPCLENAKREEEDVDTRSKPTEDHLQEEECKKKQEAKSSKGQMKSLKEKAYYIIKTGNTLDSHKEFLKRLGKKFRRLKQVNEEEKCNFILVFCPVVSRAGTNIEAALHQLNTISDKKHAVLVVLHCTNDPERVVPNSSRAVDRENTFTVDCLFHENIGLYKCSKNDSALKEAAEWIKNKPWMKEKSSDPVTVKQVK